MQRSLWTLVCIMLIFLSSCRPKGQMSEALDTAAGGAKGPFGECVPTFDLTLKDRPAAERARIVEFLYTLMMQGGSLGRMAELLLIAGLSSKMGPLEFFAGLRQMNPSWFTPEGGINLENAELKRALEAFERGELVAKFPEQFRDNRTGATTVSEMKRQTTERDFINGLKEAFLAELRETTQSANRRPGAAGGEVIDASRAFIQHLETIVRTAEELNYERAHKTREMVATILLEASPERGGASFYERDAMDISRAHYEGVRQAAIASANNAQTVGKPLEGPSLVRALEAMIVAHRPAATRERTFEELAKERSPSGREVVALREYIVQGAGNEAGLRELERIREAVSQRGPNARLTADEARILQNESLALREGSGRIAEIFRAQKSRERRGR